MIVRQDMFEESIWIKTTNVDNLTKIPRKPEQLTEEGKVFVQRLKDRLEQQGISLIAGEKIDTDQVLDAIHYLNCEDEANQLGYYDEISRANFMKYRLGRRDNQIEEIMIVAPLIMPLIVPEGTTELTIFTR